MPCLARLAACVGASCVWRLYTPGWGSGTHTCQHRLLLLHCIALACFHQWCFFIHSPKFSDDDVSGFWRGIGGMEEATFEAVSQQDDGKSLLLEPGELTSWRGDTTHQLERLETARVGLGSTTIRQLARPTLQPAHHSRYTASSRFLYSSSRFSEYSDHRILHQQALEERLEGRGRESS